ncbi:MAG: polymorphic toxin type 44 domain-containing protein [Lachnospiraceae bacterium]|jgi:hypothetical protein|nr:polymorphic toxin type 44 domain-containing protein [Lachnospiraceae bacterium]MCH4030267.1 polymorphic toxin type 44 domain-containing protein [Lachnospiraceae bacterium]MCH4069479.1 polymorphic toxin type 44 domain-containing protein [Lachnospiraceae bacterium]MCH4107585.1 polymorphic toxin type 44 domain-containing protein [Lachnospiraceae bacterium]MCI1301564.1 polymorphic toxin type 44 domain-containing protein [Lachnospiraceae bacterium]
MKKFISFVSAIIICLFSTTTVFANTSSYISKSTDNFASTWKYLKEEGYLSVNEAGFIELSSDYLSQQPSKNNYFVEIINVCNESIRLGILTICKDDFIISSTIHPQSEPKLKSNYISPPILRRNGAHGCSYQSLDLISMCSNNYNKIISYYNTMEELSKAEPDISPWGATAAFWIHKVKEHGEWDYKEREEFKDGTFCSYFDGNFQHISAEYIGNFNYGYTGSFLFSINTLLAGSFTVGGFSPADFDDWPAIRSGYENAP